MDRTGRIVRRAAGIAHYGMLTILDALADLVFLSDCPVCARPLTRDIPVPGHYGDATVLLSTRKPLLCSRCARLAESEPIYPTPTHDPGIPLLAAGPYGGVHRALILAAKEHGRKDARRVLALLSQNLVQHAVAEGILPDPRFSPWILIPAPTTVEAARARGGDLITAYCRAVARQWGVSAVTGQPLVRVAPLLQSSLAKQDQVGLGWQQRRQNLSGTVLVNRTHPLMSEVCGHSQAGHPVILFDDVLTTGSTLSESVLSLRTVGVRATHGLTLVAA